MPEPVKTGKEGLQLLDWILAANGKDRARHPMNTARQQRVLLT